MKNVDVGAVVVNYCGAQDTVACVTGLLDQESVATRVVIVDNASPDGSGAMLRDVFRGCRDVEVLQAAENRGYGAGNNMGMLRLTDGVRPKLLLVSNPDITLVHSKTLHMLARAAEDLNLLHHETVGALAPQIITASGERQNPYRVADLSRPGVLLEKARYVWPISRAAYRRIQLWRYRSEHRPPPASRREATAATPVFALHGSFVLFCAHSLLRRKLIPLFDERVFLFCEELVVARRLAASGLLSFVVESELVRHQGDTSLERTWGADRLYQRISHRHDALRHIMSTYY